MTDRPSAATSYMDKIVKPSSICGTVRPPCSKIYAQRAFVSAMLADGESVIRNIELCEDTRTTLRMASALGASVSIDAEGSLVRICGGAGQPSQRIDAGDSGLGVRMFVPLAATFGQEIRLSGPDRITRHEAEMMAGVMQQLGADMSCSRRGLPVRICGPLKGGEATVPAGVSSQFITGLLTALPLSDRDTTVHLEEPSEGAYTDMTLRMLDRFGIRAEHNELTDFLIPGRQRFTATDMSIEGDWSTASFWLIAAAVRGSVTISDMDPMSCQTDTRVISALQRAGAAITTTSDSISVRHRNLEGFEFDASQSPDLIPALSVLGAMCEGTTRITGVSALLSDSARAKAVIEEFPEIGIGIRYDSDADAITVRGGGIRGGSASSLGDHRIAMSLAVAGLCSSEGVTIRQAEAADKSYPTFWEDLDSLREE